MRSLWNPYILYPLWTIHIVVLVPPLYTQLRYVVFRSLTHPELVSAWTAFWLLDFVAMLACLVLVGVELARWRAGRLETRYFFKVSMYQTAYWTWNLAWAIHRRDWYGKLGLLKAVGDLLAFGLGLTYAMYVRSRERKRGPGPDDRMLEDERRSEALCPADSLNSAASIKSKSPVLVSLAMWVRNDPAWMATMPASAKIFLSPLSWVGRYVLGYVPILTLPGLTARLPGEPRFYWNGHTSVEMSSWDYPKPNVSSKESYSDAPARSRLPSPFPHDDEEAAVDTLSLRTIEDDARRLGPGPARSRNFQPSPSRLLGPRYLCFLADKEDPAGSYKAQKVEDWMAQGGTRNEPDYIFISYTRQQFYSQIYNDPTITQEDLVHRREASDRDKAILTDFAVKAARDANVLAFWIDFECVQPEDEAGEDLDMEDVYRICDIVRGSHALTIICGPALDKNLNRSLESDSHAAEWLLNWGKRLWTLPEALLCPSEHRISIYAVGTEEPERIAKRNLPSRLWDDAATIRQLIDHYEASLQLSKLELISIALECLKRRQTEKRNAGDVAYALMGLLRLRPKVNKSDTDFQAFARLSLANDSDRILERLICVRSLESTSSWHDMQDTWDAKLWHIDPVFQISDVGPNNAVVIGDAAGTSIDWESLQMVDFTGTVSSYTWRWLYIRAVSAYITVYGIAYLMVLFALAPAKNQGRDSDSSRRVLALVSYPWILWLLLGFAVPYVVSGLFRGRITATQARLFGIAGSPNVDEVEKCVLGDACGRFRWNIDGSVDEDGDDARPIFTLVDTLSLTLTTFRASRPPTMIFVGGRERGMLRVLLCSYDAARRCFVKETVARLESVVSTRLPRLDKFRFSVQSKLEAVEAPRQDLRDEDAYDGDLMELPDIPEFISLDE